MTGTLLNPDGADPRFMNGAWWFAFSRGVGLFVVGYFAVPFIARFYADSGLGDLTGMLRFAFLTVLFKGAWSTRAFVAQKEMDFRRWAVVNHGGGMIGIATAIVLGYTMRSPWALVIGFVVEAAAGCLLSYVVCPFLPRLRFERRFLEPLFRYARGIFGLPVLTFLFNRSDVFVIGKICTGEELGLYIVAFGLAQTPNILFGSIVIPVLMPLFSKLQGTPERLRSEIFRLVKYVVLGVVPIWLLMAGGGRFLLRLLYGEPYGQVSGAFAILCSTVALRMVSRIFVTAFFATGRPELVRWVLVVRLSVMLALIVPLTGRYGLAGAATAGFVAQLIGDCFNYLTLSRVMKGWTGDAIAAEGHGKE